MPNLNDISLNQRKTFEKTVLTVSLILLPFVGFLLGIQYKQDKSTPRNSAKVDELNEQLAQKEEEIQLLLNDSAKIGSSSKPTYSFKNFGVYSPLFENKQVTNTTYTYKRQIITEKSLILEEDGQMDSTAGIIVWEYTSRDNTTSDSNKPYVIFGGYENYANHPTRIDPHPKDKGDYTNPKDINMFWGYQYCPKFVCNVTLSFFSKYSPSGHPIYVQIWANNPSYLSDGSLNSTGLLQTKEKLKKIADTVEDSSTYH